MGMGTWGVGLGVQQGRQPDPTARAGRLTAQVPVRIPVQHPTAVHPTAVHLGVWLPRWMKVEDFCLIGL